MTLCFSGKKDAEGWETVQRGRPARPRSAAIVAKVSPVLAHVTPKQDSAKENQSQLLPQEEQQLCPPCPQDKDGAQTDSEQPVPVEPGPMEKAGDSENRHMMEVLRPTPLFSDVSAHQHSPDINYSQGAE